MLLDAKLQELLVRWRDTPNNQTPDWYVGFYECAHDLERVMEGECVFVYSWGGACENLEREHKRSMHRYQTREVSDEN